MYPVSENFKQAIYAGKRRTVAKIAFEILDIDAFEDNSKTATSEADISRPEQTTNKRRSMSAKYATFEPDYWRLDGSFVIPPGPEEEPSAEVGWWSEALCDEGGEFGPAQVLEFSFSKEHSSVGLSVAFDTGAGEYATDFEVSAYKGDNTLIHTEAVTDNTEALYVLVHPLDEYKKVVLAINKWVRGNRRARVTEVDFGVVREYGGDKLASLNLLEEIDLASAALPSAELKFVVDNSSREFNILNPDGFYRFLQQRQEVALDMGLEVSAGVFEYVRMGQYYLSDWQSDEGSLTTTFIARNAIDLLDDTELENLADANTNLYDLGADILDAAGIKAYQVDEALQTITTQAIYKKATCRQLLQYVCEAGMAVAFTDRSGSLIIQQLIDGGPMDDITFENVADEPQIKLDQLVSAVEVAIYENGEVVDTYRLDNGVAGGAVIKIDNPLINSLVAAQAVAVWRLELANRRALYEVNWRQNPALDLADTVTVEDAYGTDRPAQIIRQEYEYQGALSGKTKLVGSTGDVP